MINFEALDFSQFKFYRLNIQANNPHDKKREERERQKKIFSEPRYLCREMIFVCLFFYLLIVVFPQPLFLHQRLKSADKENLNFLKILLYLIKKIPKVSEIKIFSRITEKFLI